MTKFAIHTQVLENYGAHAEDGKFASGNAYWKFKPGTTYIVSDCERLQDAVAFVMAAFSENSIGWKEYPCHYETEGEWLWEEHREIQREGGSVKGLVVGIILALAMYGLLSMFASSVGL